MGNDPAKTLNTTSRTDVLLFPELVRAPGRPRASLVLVSPYFVPGTTWWLRRQVDLMSILPIEWLL